MDETNQSPQQTPEVTPGEPNTAASLESPQPKRKLSKVAWLVIGGLVLLVVLAVFAASSLLTKDSKQEYQNAISAALEVNQSYTDMAYANVSRASLDYQMSVEQLNTLRGNVDRILAGGESAIYETLNTEALKEVEEEERNVAKAIAEEESRLDELVAKINDEDTQAAFAKYKEARTRLYGSAGDALTSTERYILAKRVGYGCSEISKDGAFSVGDVTEAKHLVVYAERCRLAMQGTLNSESSEDSQKEFAGLMNDMLGDLVSIVQPMIDSGNVNSSSIESTLEEKYGERLANLGATEDAEKGSQDEVNESLSRLIEVMVDKREEAPGKAK